MLDKHKRRLKKVKPVLNLTFSPTAETVGYLSQTKKHQNCMLIILICIVEKQKTILHHNQLLLRKLKKILKRPIPKSMANNQFSMRAN